MRVVMTRVLPVPAPARTRSGPSVVEAASRWPGLSEARRRLAARGARRRAAEEEWVDRDKGRSYTTAGGEARALSSPLRCREA